jgi:hypothetical protein
MKLKPQHFLIAPFVTVLFLALLAALVCVAPLLLIYALYTLYIDLRFRKWKIKEKIKRNYDDEFRG